MTNKDIQDKINELVENLKRTEDKNACLQKENVVLSENYDKSLKRIKELESELEVKENLLKIKSGSREENETRSSL